MGAQLRLQGVVLCVPCLQAHFSRCPAGGRSLVRRQRSAPTRGGVVPASATPFSSHLVSSDGNQLNYQSIAMFTVRYSLSSRDLFLLPRNGRITRSRFLNLVGRRTKIYYIEVVY